MRKRLIAATAAVAVVGVAVGTYLVLHGREPRKSIRTFSRVPNIVLINTDDMRLDSLSAMPIVRRLLGDHGVTFTNAFVTTSLCCPSRASMLTGTYAHTNGVWTNGPPYGGFHAFHSDHSTIATWLRAAGYRTGLFGKYLNKYENTRYVPPGWDRWVAWDGGRCNCNFYYHYWLNIDGKLKWYGTGPQNYSTDVLADDVVSFIKGSDSPMFVYFAPYAPHLPSTPADRDKHAFQGLPPSHPPNYNEADVSDKPAWVRGLPTIGPPRNLRLEKARIRALASLQAVDRAVGRIVQTFAQEGRLRNTVFVFTSDNAYAWGEHRWTGKNNPYEEVIRVPLVIRYDALRGVPRDDAHIVANIDLAPTFADLAHAVPTSTVDGRSLVPLLRQADGPWRKDLLIEQFAIGKAPSFCAVHTGRYEFVAYPTKETELYDLQSDPYQLTNVVSDRRYARLIRHFEKRLRELCNPPPPLSPPGFPP